MLRVASFRTFPREFSTLAVGGIVRVAGRAESNGIFLDAGAGGFVIGENVFYNVAKSPLRFNHGWKNLVRNNVLQMKRGVPFIRYHTTVKERIRLEGHTIVRKIVERAIKKTRARAGRKSRRRD